MSKTASKVLTGALAFILFATTAFANPQMGISRIGIPEVHKNIVHLNEVHPTALEQLQAMGGLTFYKDFTKIPAGTYSDAGLLNADYSIGSPVATFTSTSGSFTITSSGYQATTANDEALKYLIAGNRTAAQETIVIKFTTQYAGGDGQSRYLLDSEVSSGNPRQIGFTSTDSTMFCYNADSIKSTKTISNATTYTVSFVSVSQAGNPNSLFYWNNDLETTSNTDWANRVYGTYFFIGCHRSTPNLQAKSIIESIAILNRALTASEVLALNGLM